MFKEAKKALVGILTVTLLTTSVAFAAPVTDAEEVTYSAQTVSGGSTSGNDVSGNTVSINSVTVTPSSLNLEVGETATLSAVAKDASGKAVADVTYTYVSKNTGVATVNQGVVTGEAVGETTITVTATKGESSKTTEVSVIVTAPAVSANEITLNVPASATVEAGKTTKLNVTATASKGGTVTLSYKSDNESIAKVATDGTVTGVAKGATVVKVTAKAAGATDVTKTVNVTVTEATKQETDEPTVTGLVVTPKTAEVVAGKTVALTAKATVSGNGTAAITYKSADETVATVDAKGVVTGVKEGKTTVTVTATLGKSTKTETVAITVKSAAVAQKNAKAANGSKVTTAADGTATVNTAYAKKKAKSVKVADKVVVDGVSYTVTTVGANAFKSVAKTATSVTLPATITKIDKNAFKGLKKLKKITMKVTTPVTVAKGAFSGVDTKKVTITVSKKMSKKDLAKFKKALKKAGFKGSVKAK